jgi:predicted ABC-type ATPase
LTPPIFWIVAGANGSGKTTIASDPKVQSLLGLPPQPANWLNPDKLAEDIRRQSPAMDVDAANLKAAQMIEAMVDQRIDSGQTLVVETVLSSEKYLGRMERAHARGFLVAMIYVALPSPALAIERVALRVSAGGHAVPEEKIVSRWHRSHEMLARFVPTLDALYVFSNASASGAELVAHKLKGVVRLLKPGSLPEVERHLQAYLRNE